VGEAPQTASDVLAPGDVVYVRPDGGGEDDPSWRLAQLPVAQSALISLNPDTGAVEAMQGGYSFYASKFNRALQARRQAAELNDNVVQGLTAAMYAAELGDLERTRAYVAETLAKASRMLDDLMLAGGDPDLLRQQAARLGDPT